MSWPLIKTQFIRFKHNLWLQAYREEGREMDDVGWVSYKAISSCVDNFFVWLVLCFMILLVLLLYFSIFCVHVKLEMHFAVKRVCIMYMKRERASAHWCEDKLFLERVMSSSWRDDKIIIWFWTEWIFVLVGLVLQFVFVQHDKD